VRLEISDPIQREVSRVISDWLGKPVVAGFTNGGWPVIRPAEDPTGVVYSSGDMPAHLRRLIEAMGRLCELLDELDREMFEIEEDRRRVEEGNIL
jgi:hypothetical protein